MRSIKPGAALGVYQRNQTGPDLDAGPVDLQEIVQRDLRRPAGPPGLSGGARSRLARAGGRAAAVVARRRPAMNRTAASGTKAYSLGRPGTGARASTITAPTISGRLLSVTCAPISWPRLDCVVALVTSMPDAVATISAGICETRPSPIVRME